MCVTACNGLVSYLLCISALPLTFLVWVPDPSLKNDSFVVISSMLFSHLLSHAFVSFIRSSSWLEESVRSVQLQII